MSTQIPFTNAQANLNQLCEQVIETGETVVITCPDGKNVFYLKLN